MTPAARIAAAIEILDAWREGTPVEKVLTNWARRSRFAGSKDRAAVRDHVFEALRNLNSFAALGAGESGRAIMIGALRSQGQDVDDYFTGEGHAPAPLVEAETIIGRAEDVVDLPDWILPQMQASLGQDFNAIEQAMRQRAPLFLRVNQARTTRDKVIDALAREDITAIAHDLSETALKVTENPRRFAASAVYRDGLAEIQDAASQAVSDLIPIDGPVLDFCAGGGGKSLALAARGAKVTAHDISEARMRDIPERARRAGVRVDIKSLPALKKAPRFATVFADAPCSGAGSWRRDPEGKWRLTEEQLQKTLTTQAEVMRTAAGLVMPGGILAYATCSLLEAENDAQCSGFLADHPGWSEVSRHHFTPLQGGDGFFLAILRKP
ncbi:RsmB/NOP family class I SAM-dependent RNA methyltransferase [Thalassobius sp. I31.1]|uniref:RsmB/NOP family class I SAM-dependent RNA methyltransferase n=1 Tax=Thalassobius sp. I31.1 TaxID=2109912 RepID=UPI000D1BDE33|nr:RsmB/NOP family class I SAM-dependent RNA methyltransferase [Thalassobius sp. I31.1]